jgi:flagellar protein FliS
MPISTTLRDRYRNDAVQTMSPGQLVVALYDRLLLDLHRAVTAIETGDLSNGHACLVHAQAIVAELDDSLDVEAWPAGQGLSDLYKFVQSQLISANLAKEVGPVHDCITVVEPLRDAWREAAGAVLTRTLREGA